MPTITDHIDRVTELSNLTAMNARHAELIDAVAWALDSEAECAGIMDAHPRYADYCRRNYRIACDDRKLALTELGEWEQATGPHQPVHAPRPQLHLDPINLNKKG